MREIAIIIKEIKDEIKDASKYSDRSKLVEDNFSKEIYRTLALQEIDHVNKLHDIVTKKIQEYKATGATVPEGMKMVWDFEHEEIVKDVENLRKNLN